MGRAVSIGIAKPMFSGVDPAELLEQDRPPGTRRGGTRVSPRLRCGSRRGQGAVFWTTRGRTGRRLDGRSRWRRVQAAASTLTLKPSASSWRRSRRARASARPPRLHSLSTARSPATTGSRRDREQGGIRHADAHRPRPTCRARSSSAASVWRASSSRAGQATSDASSRPRRAPSSYRMIGTE